MMFLRLLTMNENALGYFTIQQCGELFSFYSFEFCKENRNVIKFSKFICEWHTICKKYFYLYRKFIKYLREIFLFIE